MADDPIKFPEPLELDLTKWHAGVHNFATWEEANAWVREQWNRIGTQATIPNNSPTGTLFTQTIQGLNSYRELRRKRPNQEHSTGQLFALLKNMFLTHGFPTEGSPRGQFIKRLSSKHKATVAGAAVRALVEPAYSPKERGLFEAVIFEQGLKENAVAERAALTDLHRTWTDRVSEELQAVEAQRNEAEAAKQSAEQALKKARAALQTQREEYRERFKAHGETLKQLHQGFETHVAALKEKYTRNMEMHHAVDYWETRRGKHEGRAGKSQQSAKDTGVLVLLYLVMVLFLAAQPFHKPHLLAIYGAGAVVLLWYLRVQVKLFMTEKHLEVLSEERVVMLKSYLALTLRDHDESLTDEQRLKADERMLILSTLFTHSTSGLVKEDTGPPGALDLVTKLMAGKALGAPGKKS